MLSCINGLAGLFMYAYMVPLDRLCLDHWCCDITCTRTLKMAQIGKIEHFQIGEDWESYEERLHYYYYYY